jgi:FixJ family two-component response regulator
MGESAQSLRHEFGRRVSHGAKDRFIGPDESVVFIVDENLGDRTAIAEMLARAGIRSIPFASLGEFMDFPKPNCVSCLLFDLQSPDLDGLEFLERMNKETIPPIVYVTAHGDIALTVRAMRSGAIDFLPKPLSQTVLLRAVESAFDHDEATRKHKAEKVELRRRYSLLTPRERDVLSLVVAGLLNKQSAAQLGISEITLQIHRGKVMRKMAAQSLADLVRMEGKLELHGPSRRAAFSR